VVQQLAVDARNPNNVYAVWDNAVTRHTSDSGATWSPVPFPGTAILSLALDPRVSQNVYAYSVPFFSKIISSPSFIYRSANGGTDWAQITTQAPASPGLTVDASTNPSTVYAGLSARTVDGGITWTPLGPSPVSGGDTSAVVVDPSGTQAPLDTAVGAVDVVVTNNGAASAPAPAQLQAVAPAFFKYPNTNYAVASRLPDYAAVADPAAVPGAVPARPGDLVVVWGTGFGTTNPQVSAGTVVSGAPRTVATPTVTVGGVAAEVVSTVLTTGSAGLYQVTIRIPDSAPAGAIAVQASAGGAPAAGVMIFVAR
jgi:uncharacterized protein (TIGR03437 family)